MQAMSILLTIGSVFLLIIGFSLTGGERGQEGITLFLLAFAGLVFAAILYNRYSRAGKKNQH